MTYVVGTQSVWSENTGYVEHRRHGHHSGRQTVSRHTQAPFIAQAAVSYGYSLCVDEHVLLEVLPPHEQLVTVVTLEVLLPRVDDHVGFQVSLLGERLVTQSTPVVLLTCTLTRMITL